MQQAVTDPHKWEEIWREDRHDPLDPDGFYSDKVRLCRELSALQFECGGMVVTRTIKEWHALAVHPFVAEFGPK